MDSESKAAWWPTVSDLTMRRCDLANEHRHFFVPKGLAKHRANFEGLLSYLEPICSLLLCHLVVSFFI